MVALDVLVLTAFHDPELPVDELRPWLDRHDLDREVALPAAEADLGTPLYHDGSLGVLATGVGHTVAATTVSTLLAGDAVETDETLFVTAGVAGGPPERTALGSPVVHDAVVDWDRKHRVDGAVELLDHRPRDYVYDLNPALVDRALTVAADVDCYAGAVVEEAAAAYDATVPTDPELHSGPAVAGGEYWHGASHAGEAERLCEAYDVDPYLTTNVEDAGTAEALDRHGALPRWLSVRAVSNFDRPPAGAESAHGEWKAGLPIAVENAYRVASAVAADRREEPAAWTSLF